MKASLAFLVLLCALLASPRRAHAEAPRGSAFALVVTNNRSSTLARPDLRYADDDGAKYYELFRTIAPEPNVALLTTFDRDTERLFPQLVGKAKPPTKAQVFASARALAERMRAAASAGPVDLYFVFAGHGDVDRGKGFLELEGGTFTSDDLEALLRSMPATRSHVILDSCNSFFVVNARKPGGRRFVTPEDATRTFRERLPDVGIFLSTSAEAAVYEWSELQSGVFSHAVRSGLAGAADVDGDGRVSYDELAAFVSVASTDVKNPVYRPQVLARAPGGRGGEPLVDLRGARGARLRVDEARQRLTLRDANEIRWLDVHKEAGLPLTLVVPHAAAKDANVVELDPATGVALRRRAVTIPEDAGDADTRVASLPEVAASPDARGSDDVFRSLFAQPFGRTTFARYLAERATEEPAALGVAADDARRMNDLLEQAAEQAKTRRTVAGVTMGGLGVVLGAGGIYALSEAGADKPLYGVGLTTLGGVLAVTGLLATLVTSKEEDIYASFASRMAKAKDRSKVVAETEKRLVALADEYRSNRRFIRWLAVVGGASALGAGAIGVVRAEGPDERLGSGLFYGSAAAAFGFAFGWSFVKYPTEQTAAIWAKDPGIERLRSPQALRAPIEVRPVIGAGSFGLAGTF